MKFSRKVQDLAFSTILMLFIAAASRAEPPSDLGSTARINLFTGPVTQMLSALPATSGALPDDARIGISARWQYDPDRVIEYLKQANIKWLRLGYDEDAAPVLKLARKANLKVLLMLAYGPADTMSPDDLADWYVAKAEKILDGNLDVVKAVQIWNEPFNFPRTEKGGKRMSAWVARYGGRWYGGPYVTPFGQFTARVASELRKRYPELTLVGGTKIVGSTLQVLETDKPPLDAVYLQPYPRDWPPELLRTANDPWSPDLVSDWRVGPAIDKIMERARTSSGNQDLRLWITEIGATTYVPEGPVRKADFPPVSEEMQAQLYARIWATYMHSEVERLFFFLLNDEKSTPVPDQPNRNFAIIASGWRPKPAWFVLARLNALTSATPVPDDSIQFQIRDSGEKHKPRQTLLTTVTHRSIAYAENILVFGFRSPRVPELVAIWRDGTLPVDGQPPGEPWEVGLRLPQSIFDCGVIGIDPLTGGSWNANTVHTSDGLEVTVQVSDYPIILVPSKPNC